MVKNKNFQTKSHIYRLVESSIVLDLTNQAHKSAAVLSHNYLGSTWCAEAYKLLQEDSHSHGEGIKEVVPLGENVEVSSLDEAQVKDVWVG